MRVIWKCWKQARNSIELHQWNFSNSGEGSGGQNTERNMNYKGYADEVSDRIEDCTGCWTRSYSYYSVAKNLIAICPFPETLVEAEFKDDGPVYLVENISRQQSIAKVAWVPLAAFSQVYSENQEHKTPQWKYWETCSMTKRGTYVKF